jgi:peroxiredoxin (alkyl hydroperoxide reductase subunit C)
MAFVGKKFPNLSVDAMNEMGDTFKVNVLEEAINNKKKVILFWYPKDFTFVCPTELHAFEAAKAEFEKRNTIVIGASCDTPEVHFAWLSTAKDNGGIEGVTYPILADSNRNLASTLGILDISNETYNEETGVVLVEGDNHMPLGRNIAEFLRLIDAYTHVQEKGEVCPANWEEGKDAMQPNAKGTASYLASH